MSDPRRNRPATAMFLAGILVAAIAGYALLRSEPAESPPPVAPRVANDAAPETAGESAANRAAAESVPTAAATSPDAPQVGPTGTVVAQLRFLGARRSRVQFVVTDDRGDVIASAERRGDRDEVVAELTVPAHEWIRVGAVTFDEAETGAAVPQVRTKLGPGERQVVQLECSAVVTQLRLVGPSARLLPHLTILIKRVLLDVAHDARPFLVRPDANGVAACHLPETLLRASLAISEGPSILLLDSSGATDLTQRGGDLELRPAEPVLGIVVEQRGTIVPSAISLTGPVLTHRPWRCHATTRRFSSNAEFVFGCTEELGPFRVSIDAVRRDTDLWVIDPGSEHRLGQLAVKVAEPPERTSRLELIAHPFGGGPPQRLDRVNGTPQAVLVVGDYRLDWEVNGGDAATALELVRIEAGKTTELHLQPLPLQRWEVHVQLPRDCTESVSLRLSGILSIGSRSDGVLPIDLATSPRVGDRGEVIVVALGSKFAATVTAVDFAARRAEVASTLADAAWLCLAASPMAGRETRVFLQPDHGMDPVILVSGTLVPLLPGHPRDGCVFEGIDSENHLVRWFRVQAGAPPPQLSGQGRWTTLAIERQVVRATVSAEGPDTAAPVQIRSVKGPGPHRLFVADGTRAVHVDLEPGGRRTFDAALPAFTVR